MNLHWRQSIPLQWNAIQSTQDELKSRLDRLPRKAVEEIVMSVSELIENAVKYGIPGPSGEGILVELDIEASEVQIRVTNMTRSELSVQTVRDHIDRLLTVRPEALYFERMKELFDHKQSDRSQLGLYRIASEGMFRLSYEYRDRLLTIVARRTLGEA